MEGTKDTDKDLVRNRDKTLPQPTPTDERALRELFSQWFSRALLFPVVLWSGELNHEIV